MTEGPDKQERPAKKAREPRSRAGWLAALFTLALVGWMGSGYIWPNESDDAGTAPEEKKQAFAVEALDSEAEPVTQFVSVEGQVVPNRTTPVRAKVGGTVESIAVEKGSFLEEGALIARIALADRSAQQDQARAELERTRNEFDRTQSLVEQGYATQSQLESARAALRSAQATVAQIEETTGNTAITAPITGVLDDLNLDVGEFVGAADEVGTQVDNSPLKVDVNIAQQAIGKIHKGEPAAVQFITGETRQGTVTYVASNAAQSTRTFAVEITVPNPKRDTPAGISAQVRIPTGETSAHFMSTALLALGPDGELGVKTVDEDDTVAFYPVDLVRAETDGIWVSGLPERARLISVGQGFVSKGEPVRVIAPSDEPGGEPLMKQPTSEPAEGLVSQVQDGASGDDFSGDAAPSPGSSSGADGNGGDAAQKVAAMIDRTTSGVADGGQSVQNLSDLPVQLVQQRLAALGYDPGPTDGVMGESTRAAIRKFQAEHSLEVTGEIDMALASALLASSTGSGAGGDQG